MDDQERQLRAAALEYGHGDALLAEVERICTAPDVRAAYDRQFILQCASLPETQRYDDVRQKLRTRFSAKEFSIKEWDRRIREAQRDLDVSRGTSGPAWHAALNLSDRGPRPILQNAIAALRVAPEWQGVLAYNQFADRLTTRALAPWMDDPRDWTDADDIRLADWLQSHGILVDKRIAGQAVEVVGRDQPFNPVRDYLGAQEWDKTNRLDSWVEDYLGATPANDANEDDDHPEKNYLATIGRMWMISAVARILQPGCKVDTCLVLEGKQGKRKSTALAALFEPWFSDCISILGSKDARMEVHGVWLIEIADLSSYRAAELNNIRSFISSKTDRFRKPYDRHLVELPRQSVFAATSNDDEWAKDPAGERRMWPVRCEGTINIPGLRDVRTQLWAEAVARHNAGEHWWIEEEAVEEAAQFEQQSRYVPDPWGAAIDDFFRKPENAGLEQVTTEQLLTKAVQVPIEKQNSFLASKVGTILRSSGWVRKKVRPAPGDRPQWVYQKQ